MMSCTIDPLLDDLRHCRPAAWLRPAVSTALDLGADGRSQIEEARQRFERFRRPLAMLAGDGAWDGAIRSDLIDAPAAFPGRVLLKADHALPMTGSIKARGGVHELLKYAERIAVTNGLSTQDGDYASLATPEAAAVFARYEVSVASTGNLGFSIGLVGRALGLRTTIHMSRDAKAWKKNRLRDLGATVVEHDGDYGQACAAARAATPADDRHHFVDDESSPDLFWGYAVAAAELAEQLADRGLSPTPARPLVVYLPCGVGGAPGGISFGLKTLFNDAVVCVFAEPTHSPCFLAALATESDANQPPSVYAYGLDNRTVADGLAVAAASPLALSLVGGAVDAAVSVTDEAMLTLAAALWDQARLRLEPSAVAGLASMPMLVEAADRQTGWPDLSTATHVAWLTGGALLPDAEWERQYQSGKLVGERALMDAH